MDCPHCGKEFCGSPRVVKPGELYECRCQKCWEFWELDKHGNIITEDEDGNDKAGTDRAQ